MRNSLQQIVALWRQLGLNQRVSLALSAAAVVAGMAGLLLWASRPRMALLYGRLDEKVAGEVVAALGAQGVRYQLGAGGTSIFVPEAQVAATRMALAAKGLPAAEGVGFEVFDKGNFGISDFVQRTNYLRAIQGELSRTIAGLQGVRSARVMVVMPENRLLLADNRSRPTASVFVDHGGVSLGADAVNSIRFLVANAVENLRVDDVAVVDNRGNVLSESLRDDPALAAASSQMKYRRGMEDYLGAKVETMLARVLGPGNAVVRVAAEIDTEQSTTVQERFDPEGQVVRTQSTTEDSSLSSEKKNGTEGTGISANAPKAPPAAGVNGANKDAGADAAPARTSEQSRKNQSQTYEIGKATTNTVRNPGQLKRVTAAVFLATRPALADGSKPAAPRTAQELAGVQQMVANALGVVVADPAELNGLVTVQEAAFPAEAAVAAASVGGVSSSSSGGGSVAALAETFRPYVAPALAGVVLLVFLRMLKRTRPDELPLELLEPRATTRREQLEVSRGGLLVERTTASSVSPQMLNDMIRQKPAHVSTALRDWMAEK